MFTDVKKKTQKKFDVTILTQVVIGILDLWNARPILVFPKKISRKAAIRPIVPIDMGFKQG